MEFANGSRADWDALGISEGNAGDVCGDCIGDPAFREFIAANATSTSCTYCGQARDTPFAAPVSRVVEHMARIINEEFQHTAVTAADENNGFYFTFDKLLYLPEIGFWPNCLGVRTDIISFFDGRRWSFKDTFADHLELAWKWFCKMVTHSRRYTFWLSMENVFPEGYPRRPDSRQGLTENSRRHS